MTVIGSWLIEPQHTFSTISQYLNLQLSTQRIPSKHSSPHKSYTPDLQHWRTSNCDMNSLRGNMQVGNPDVRQQYITRWIELKKPTIDKKIEELREASDEIRKIQRREKVHDGGASRLKYLRLMLEKVEELADLLDGARDPVGREGEI